MLRQRPRTAACSWPLQLRNGLDLAAQVAPGDGPPRTGLALRNSGGGRDLCRRGGERASAAGKPRPRPLLRSQPKRNGKGIGRIRLRQVKDVSGASLLPFIQSAVAPGAAVHTDGWSGYSGLMAAGYKHQVTIISASPDPAHVAMPRVHNIAALLKRWLLGTHQGGVQHRHLDYYLDEFAFRFNRRRSKARGLLFHRLAQQAVALGPATFDTITKQPTVLV